MSRAPRSPVRRVLMTADAVGGVWEYALELAAGLSAAGTETVLAVMGPGPSPAKRMAAAAIPGLTLVERDFALEWMPDAEHDMTASGEWLLKIEARWTPDIVHVNGYAHAALPWRAPCLAVAHSCVTTWWRAVHGADPPADWDSYRARVRDGLAAADLVVAPTAAFLRMLEEAYGPVAGALVIPNGRAAPAGSLPPKERIVLTAGRIWDAAKNIVALDAVAAALDWPLYAAGDLRAPDGRRREPRNLICLGALPQSELRAWMGRAAVFALPARYEPFGLSVLEAAQAGCALVLGDIPTLRELWDGAALFVPPDDHDALEAALSGLIEAPARVETLAVEARRRARDYSADRMSAAYLALYARLAQPQPSLACGIRA